MNLSLCLAVVGLLAVHHWLRRVGSDFAVRLALLALAAVALTTYTNGFRFHGERHWAHLHDVAHYYLGSKYADEVGYANLYTAMVRAEAEEYGNCVASDARELTGNYLMPVVELLARSDAVKGRFSESRWADFRRDVHFFRDAMGQAYGNIVRDHGYNPTPVWSLIGGKLANFVPAGSESGILALTLLDPALLAIALSVVAATSGVETALLVMIYYCICFGAAFDWTGGAFLREMSFCAVLVAGCWSGGRRPAAAGSLLALAACLRVFPVFLAFGVLSRAIHDLWQGRRGTPAQRFAIWFAAAGAALVGASCIRYAGVGVWQDFARNIAAHSESASSNIIGLTNWLASLGTFDVRAPGGFGELMHWRQTVYRAQVVTLLPIASLYIFVKSRHRSVSRNLAAGTLLVFVALNLSAYYYKYLAMLIPVYRSQPVLLAWLFGTEAVVYLLALVDPQPVMLYWYKSLLLGSALLLIELRAAPDDGQCASSAG